MLFPLLGILAFGIISTEIASELDGDPNSLFSTVSSEPVKNSDIYDGATFEQRSSKKCLHLYLNGDSVWEIKDSLGNTEATRHWKAEVATYLNAYGYGVY